MTSMPCSAIGTDTRCALDRCLLLREAHPRHERSGCVCRWRCSATYLPTLDHLIPILPPKLIGSRVDTHDRGRCVPPLQAGDGQLLVSRSAASVDGGPSANTSSVTFTRPTMVRGSFRPDRFHLFPALGRSRLSGGWAIAPSTPASSAYTNQTVRPAEGHQSLPLPATVARSRSATARSHPAGP